jgi:hypothetical protein
MLRVEIYNCFFLHLILITITNFVTWYMCAQVTKFKCGGAVVGCTFDHRVCDAYSFNMFLVA